MKYQRPKGTADILPGDSEKWQFIEKKARALFKKFRYQEMRTPIFENFEVFSRTSGETSDIVTKEMYDFFDKGDRHVTLRPEGTAGVVRSYVENKLYQKFKSRSRHITSDRCFAMNARKPDVSANFTKSASKHSASTIRRLTLKSSQWRSNFSRVLV